jgi:hypothetical protein
MKLSEMIIPASALAVGTLFGSVIAAAVLNKKKAVGTLRFDTSDPDEDPYMFLELKRDNVPAIMGKKYVVLKVNTESYLPRK